MFSRTAALLPIAARPKRLLPSFLGESTSNRSPQMTTKWASPGHSHSPANSDQALAQEAVAQGPGKHWPQMLSKMFLGSVCPPRKRGNTQCGPGCERDSGSQSCVWEQLYSMATAMPLGLKLLAFLTQPTSLGRCPCGSCVYLL